MQSLGFVSDDLDIGGVIFTRGLKHYGALVRPAFTSWLYANPNIRGPQGQGNVNGASLSRARVILSSGMVTGNGILGSVQGRNGYWEKDNPDILYDPVAGQTYTVKYGGNLSPTQAFFRPLAAPFKAAVKAAVGVLKNPLDPTTYYDIGKDTYNIVQSNSDPDSVKLFGQGVTRKRGKYMCSLCGQRGHNRRRHYR